MVGHVAGDYGPGADKGVAAYGGSADDGAVGTKGGSVFNECVNRGRC